MALPRSTDNLFNEFDGFTPNDLLGFLSLQSPPKPGPVAKFVGLLGTIAKLPFVGTMKSLRGAGLAVRGVGRLLMNKTLWIVVLAATVGAVAVVPSLRNKILGQDPEPVDAIS